MLRWAIFSNHDHVLTLGAYCHGDCVRAVMVQPVSQLNQVLTASGLLYMVTGVRAVMVVQPVGNTYYIPT